MIKVEEIEEAFDAKKEALIDVCDAEQELSEAEKRKIEKEMTIAEHDMLAREAGTPEACIIKGKNDTERSQARAAALKDVEMGIIKAKNELNLKKLALALADVQVKEIDFKLRLAEVSK